MDFGFGRSRCFIATMMTSEVTVGQDFKQSVNKGWDRGTLNYDLKLLHGLYVLTLSPKVSISPSTTPKDSRVNHQCPEKGTPKFVAIFPDTTDNFLTDSFPDWIDFFGTLLMFIFEAKCIFCHLSKYQSLGLQPLD
ncbi:hypothetical protein BTVI_56605 [Pitangus sulphuratus]|nr:hypothetical protein BTVI_56605 [Pitangus sulphuratus]